MDSDDERLIARAEAWIVEDPDPETRTELAGIVDAARTGDGPALAELHDRFDRRLAFGTAGLRGRIAAGPNRMNRVLVMQAAAGIAAFLAERAAGEPGRETPSVVIGWDGRKNSEVFARDSAEIIAGAGLRAILMPRMLPTPVLAFAVRHLDTDAGIMVTASHNPPHDNGYKVYLGGADAGSQLVSPQDAEIADLIERAAASAPVSELPRGAAETAPESLVREYVAQTASVAVPTLRVADAITAPVPALQPPAGAMGEAAASLARIPAWPPAQPLVAYTAMHGVGADTFFAVVAAAGFMPPKVVARQLEPDPAFPTVSFPNPEEPGAMDLVFERAGEVGADLVIAHDPDADRLAVGIPDASAEAGFRRLSGNEVGLLLGWRAARIAAAEPEGARGTLACSIVSSPGLETVARAYGLGFRATLTGFKWISRAEDLVFGYEEALGYLVNPGTVRDKDGISAAIAVLALASELEAAGVTLADHLEAFVERFGAFASRQFSLRVERIERIGELMAALRADPPAAIRGAEVSRVTDLLAGGELPPADVLRFDLDDASRIMVRPSGTEPKLKVYIDTTTDAGSAPASRAAAEARAADLETAMRELLG
ncbi:phospho-sugar mutase [Agromyces archimandritae]|uniref:phospho-sugar mutase n=1 Tax=Agromyces archimandritae TaxID=2781962 RepID=UPI001FD504B9|nr:phospho-sugar mutase [Agromyces archimandritae]